MNDTAMLNRNARRLRAWGVVLIVLLLHFGIRAFNVTAQDPYIDEGFHGVRAGVVWSFADNPGRFAHGKVGVYFWLGLFHGGDPLHTLAGFRLGMALFSLLSAAAVYQVGRTLFGRGAGALALVLYAIFPYTFFFERLGMADPYAAGWVGLVVWRSIVFARLGLKPGGARWQGLRLDLLREGALLGVLLWMTTWAKLTMGLVPLFPAFAALVYYRWRVGNPVPQGIAWLKTYLPPLVLAAGVVTAAWLPLAIPAYFAENTDRPFVLVNDYNVRSNADSDEQYAPDVYFGKILPLVEEFTGKGFVTTAGYVLLALAALGIWRAVHPYLPRAVRGRVGAGRAPLASVVLLALWVALTAGLPLVLARLITSRYFMPASAPLVIAIAGLIWTLWKVRGVRWLAAPVAAGVLVLWAGTHVFPFMTYALQDPLEVPFGYNTNWTEYQSGYLSADYAVRDAAAALDALPAGTTLVANWNLCHLLYFYSHNPVTCLRLDFIRTDLDATLRAAAECQSVYLALRSYRPFYQAMGYNYALVSIHETVMIDRPVSIVRLWRGENCPAPPGG